MKDMNSKSDLYRANAIRVLCRIIDSQMLLQIERYLKQVCEGGGGVTADALLGGRGVRKAAEACLCNSAVDHCMSLCHCLTLPFALPARQAVVDKSAVVASAVLAGAIHLVRCRPLAVLLALVACSAAGMLCCTPSAPVMRSTLWGHASLQVCCVPTFACAAPDPLLHPAGGCQRGGDQAVDQRGAGGHQLAAPHGQSAHL